MYKMKILKHLLIVAISVVIMSPGIHRAQAQTPCDLSKSFFGGTMRFTPSLTVTPDEPLRIDLSASYEKEPGKPNCTPDNIYFVVAYTGNVGSVRGTQTKEVKVTMQTERNPYSASARVDFPSFRQISGQNVPTGTAGLISVKLSVVDKTLSTGPENLIGQSSVDISAISSSGSGSNTGNNINPPNNSTPTNPNSSNTGSADVGKTFYNPINIDSIPEFIVRVINILLLLTGMLAVLFIIIGGLRYITSSGNPQAVTGAKNTVIYAILGLAFAVLSYAIVNVLTNVLINK